MTLEELKRAHAEREQLEKYQKWMRDFADFEVVGVLLKRNGNGTEVSTLSRTEIRGIYGYNFSDALGKKLTEHFQGWLSDHAQDAKKALRELGVTGQEVSDD